MCGAGKPKAEEFLQGGVAISLLDAGKRVAGRGLRCLPGPPVRERYYPRVLNGIFRGVVEQYTCGVCVVLRGVCGYRPSTGFAAQFGGPVMGDSSPRIVCSYVYLKKIGNGAINTELYVISWTIRYDSGRSEKILCFKG